MVSNDIISDFIYVDDDMAPNAHYWSESVEGTEDMAILPQEAFIWFQDPKFVKDLLNTMDDKWENPMRKDITIIKTLTQNNTDIRTTIAHLQRTADRNKVQAYSTLATMNKQRRMRKFDQVLLTR